LIEAVRDSLRALVEGKWSDWTGLVVFPSEDIVEQALGPSVDTTARSGMLGGSPTFFRRYPPAAGAPRGVTVWFEDDTAVAIEIDDPIPADGDVLDRPEATLDSQFGPEWRQEVYASRGLVLHRRDDDVALLYGIGPCTVDDWMSDPLRHSGPPTRHGSPRSPGRADRPDRGDRQTEDPFRS
jgi:hypothetical protein